MRIVKMKKEVSKEKFIYDAIGSLTIDLTNLIDKVNGFSCQHTYFHICMQEINKLSSQIMLLGIESNSLDNGKVFKLEKYKKII